MKSILQKWIIYCALTLLALITDQAQAQAQAEESPTRPNIIMIFTDDQGYNDLGSFGSPKIKTPHLDKMAREGMRFTNFYSACSVCSPSRAALMTGCYPPRVGLTRVLFPRDTVGLDPREITVAESLKEVGYQTACIGKWHMGHLPEFLPTQQGFDYYFGIPYSNDMTIDPKAKIAVDAVFREGFTLGQVREGQTVKNKVPLMRNDEVIEYPADQTTLTQRYTEKALQFVSHAHESKEPFFLYLPHTMPHIPLFASEAFRGTSARGLYGDTIEEIDWSVGQILDQLRKLGIAENTLVVYTSDNGPWKLDQERGGSAYPLRGFKFSTWEGGMRVPCIMWWPETIPCGKVNDQVAGTIDLMPTFIGVAGSPLPTDRVIDGRNILPVLTEAENSPHEAYYYYKGNRLVAVRAGEWKLHLIGKAEDPKWELYNLKSDVSESQNVAEANKEVVQRLAALIKNFDSNLKEERRFE